jgi:cell division septation protein DedD
MRNKDYRELQISSSMLVFVFIAIIVLGIIIFLLGVSVGKKQASLTEETQFAEVPIEKVEQEKPLSSEQDKDKISQEISSHMENREKKEEPAQIKQEPEGPRSGLFYIQVGAYTDKASASKIAEKYKNMGLKTYVIDPFPTDRRTIYRVRVGGYTTRDEAEEVKSNLMERENKQSSDYFIIKG